MGLEEESQWYKRRHSGDLGTVLVTGGTGSFGQAFTKRVLDEALADRVIVYSRGEHKQERMRARFDKDPRLRFYLGDVRDLDRLRMAMESVDVVVHAAALKRVDRSALDIYEFKRTIVDGAQNVVVACHSAGVRTAVFLSTDKAVEATTPYGACKAVQEWIAIAGNVYGCTRICAVRYGNVIGSQGSVLDTWARYHEAGEPLPLTDPRMTRFWLPLDDAVGLVLYALRHTGGGEVFIPKDVDCGPVRKFARKHFPGAEFEVIGKRSYEKIHERLVAAEEVDRLWDVGECYVLTPHPAAVRWAPGPWWVKDVGKRVGMAFQYCSRGQDRVRWDSSATRRSGGRWMVDLDCIGQDGAIDTDGA